MSDIMKQIPFGQLMNWILTEYADEHSIFGISNPYRAGTDTDTGKSPELFGAVLERPFGPAAGPHTQLAQNIVAAYVSGGRFFELKTVQTLDGEDLPVSKPCISAPDECYNVEWSTELYVPQALDEYIKGWFILKLISKEFGLGDENGFIFNMSVGYDLEGINSPKIDSFIEGLKNAEDTGSWLACKKWALENLSRFNKVDKNYIENISPQVCNSVTLSTLHGCPPLEIERIASYLITEKKLHTFIKCNPTLLGYDYARNTLNELGFDYMVFDDHHFKNDLQFKDAVPMFRRLQTLAENKTLSFGVKLTNTFPVKITENELPGEEMYMSGRALFPLSIEVARKLTEAFDGNLRISYSGGADINNIERIYSSGIWPVTLATTLLKPGGYKRLYKLADKLARQGDGSSVLCSPKTEEPSPCLVDTGKVNALAEFARSDALYRKPAGQPPERKMNTHVPLLDCFTAPCSDGCPINQNIPAYLRLAGEGKYLDALKVITERNPLPFITGTICSHRCMDKCMRNYYESSVHIRNVKLEAAENAFSQLIREIKAPGAKGDKVAVIGSGPAGLSAAYFLSRLGHPVTIFEKKSSPGGIVKHVIPEFRIPGTAIDNDIALIKAMGVDLRLNSEVRSLDVLRAEGYTNIIIATGAWKPGVLEIEGDAAIGALEFLEKCKKSHGELSLGENVVVIGGGNTAMDAARAAKRVHGVKTVSLVYRRTKRYMPADNEELRLALEDGIEFKELLAPVSYKNAILVCQQMQLGAADQSGRRSPVSTGHTEEIPATAVISAVGDFIDTQMLKHFDIPVNNKGKANINTDTLETDIPGVYIAGDAVDGPSSVAQAIADAIRCTEAISGQSIDKQTHLNKNPDIGSVSCKKGVLYGIDEPVHESVRCLECATICESCVDVCPNRANISVVSGGRPQIIHIDHMCNECGNCEVFCPYLSAPYRDKFTLFACMEDFNNSENQGFIFSGSNTVHVRINGKTSGQTDGAGLPEGIWELIQNVKKKEYILLNKI